MKISEDVLDVLSNATTTGNAVTLNGQLDRKLYVAVNKVLEAAGGKWNRAKKAHLFDGDAGDIMDQIILTGEIATHQELGYFPTLEDVVARVIELAEIEPGMKVLEPSAGTGHIAVAVERAGGDLSCIEIDPKRADACQLLVPKAFVSCGDFLESNLSGFDRVVMNPPFARQADIRHVFHAFKALKPKGRLVSVMSAGVTFRTNKLTTEFKALMAANNGTIEKLPEDSFKESGTSVNTVIVTMTKAA